MRPLGVDGCRGGWLAVEGIPSDWSASVCSRLHELDAQEPAGPIAVDMPIGLLDAPRPGGRECDREARQRLGPRGVTVFSPPARSRLHATGPGDGISLQAWHLLPRIRELDAAARSGAHRFVEAHPELAFAARAGRPLAPKRTAPGRRQREAVLEACGFRDVLEQVDAVRAACGRSAVATDDVLDALVLLDVAWSWASGRRRAVGSGEDAAGLPMRIAY